jgi:hypothetical protein
MAGIEAFLKGWVSRMLPQAETDNGPGIVRLGRYGDIFTVGAVRKQHVLADEGSYFVANNGGTGVATGATPTSFSDTAPMLTLYNTDSPGNQNAKRVHLDFIKLMETAAGTAGVTFRVQIKIGNGNPYSSGGTQLFPVNPNMDVPSRASVLQAYLLPTAVAMTSPRTIVGDVVCIPTTAAVIAILSTIHMNFGGVEGTPFSVIGSTANCIIAGVPLPPIVLGPNQGASINFLIGSQSAASSWTPELGWWER